MIEIGPNLLTLGLAIVSLLTAVLAVVKVYVLANDHQSLAVQVEENSEKLRNGH